MKGIEKIYDSKTLVSIIFRAKANHRGTTFVTTEELPLQIGLHTNPIKKISSTHKNGDVNLPGKIAIHEILLVQSGTMQVNYFLKKGAKIVSKKLKSGDGVLIMDVIHKISMSKNSKVIEIKQGPHAKKD